MPGSSRSRIPFSADSKKGVPAPMGGKLCSTDLGGTFWILTHALLLVATGLSSSRGTTLNRGHLRCLWARGRRLARLVFVDVMRPLCPRQGVRHSSGNLQRRATPPGGMERALQRGDCLRLDGRRPHDLLVVRGCAGLDRINFCLNLGRHVIERRYVSRAAPKAPHVLPVSVTAGAPLQLIDTAACRFCAPCQ